jgi:hypothetical protein
MDVIMCSSGRCYSIACSCIAIFVSLVIGAIVGLLYAFGIISVNTTSQWIILVLAFVLLFLVVLALLLAALSVDSPLGDCIKRGAIFLLIGILGTIILALILTSISASTVITAILVGIEAVFITLMIFALISFVSCLLCVIRT